VKYLVIDTETGGLDPVTDAVIELAGVVWDSGMPTGQEFRLVVWDSAGKISPEALKVNGWTMESIMREGLSPRDAVQRLADFCTPELFPDRVYLAAHNAKFDYAFLERLMREAGLLEWFGRRFSYRTLCTQSVLRYLALIGRIPPGVESLAAAVKHFHITQEPSHTALGDARMTADLLSRLYRDGLERHVPAVRAAA
jgi:DNA polymerase III subunit epsilon